MALATVEIPVNEMTSFDLPKVCLITGSTENVSFKPVKFSWYPRWIAVFILVGWPIALILALVLTKRAKGELPFTEDAHRRWKLGQALLALSIIAALGLFVGGVALLVSDQPVFGIACLVLCLGLPITVGVVFVQGKRILCTKIDKEIVFLKIPSASAAGAVVQHLHAGARAPAAATAIAAG
jgi:hypothetical protein